MTRFTKLCFVTLLSVLSLAVLADPPAITAQVCPCSSIFACQVMFACGCGAPARVVEGACTNTSPCSCTYTCSGVCKPPGGGDNCSGDMPFCESGAAYCNGGTWVCDDRPYQPCSGSPYWCSQGAICFDGNWICT